MFRLPLIHSILAVTLLPFAAARAEHPISVTEAQVFVASNSARVRIQLFAEDLFLFHDLQPSDIDVLPPEELRRGLNSHGDFLLDKVKLRDAAGDAYEGRVTDVQPFEIPEDGIKVEELMLHSATYEIEYPFKSPPEFLTLQQDISDESFIFPSEMKLTLHQAGTELTYTEVLKPGAAQTLRFDWSGDSLSDEATDEEWEAWFDRQREATLGITSYSSVYSFIYIEPAEVRHEILIPLATLRNILPLEHKDPAFIEIGEQDGVRKLIQEWLTDKNPATVNNSAVQPEFTRIDFYGLNLKDFAKQAAERKVSMASGRVGVILTYDAPSYPVRDVSLSWDVFNSSLRKIQSVVIEYPDSMERFEFSRFKKPEENVFRWQSEGENLPAAAELIPADTPTMPTIGIPAISLMFIFGAGVFLLATTQHKGRNVITCVVLAAITVPFAHIQVQNPFQRPPAIAASTAKKVFETLHAGAYRALDFGTEDRIYEELERSIDGDMLEAVYLQLREGLQVREQGGAVARVRSVEYAAGEQTTNDGSEEIWPGFRFRSRWTVSGTVEHWGHVHERQNQFCALFAVEPKDGVWKITDMQIEDQQSIATKTSLRKF